MVTKRYRPNHSKSVWYNSDLQGLKQKQRRFERLHKKRPNSNTLEDWKNARNNYNKKLKNTRSKYYKNKIEKYAGNQKMFYKVVGKLTGYSHETVLPSHENKTSLSEDLSLYFSEKTAKIRNSITKSGSTNFINTTN